MESKGPRLFFMAQVYSSQFLMHSDPTIANFTTLTWARVETLGTAVGPAGRNLHRFVAVGQPQLGDVSDGKEVLMMYTIVKVDGLRNSQVRWRFVRDHDKPRLMGVASHLLSRWYI